jgi:hypothetical protein
MYEFIPNENDISDIWGMCQVDNKFFYKEELSKLAGIV